MDPTSFEYRKILRSEFIDRCKRNPRYSVRAMARNIGISPAFFSQVLSGRRELSEKKGNTIGKSLGWSSGQIDLFVDLIRLSKTTDSERRAKLLHDLSLGDAQNRLKKFFGISLKGFTVVSDWYNFAILELLDLSAAQSSPAWIAARLGITKTHVETAICSMLELGLLERAGSTLKKTKNCNVGEVPSAAIRKFHSQHLDIAKTAINDQPFEMRHFSGMTMAIESSKYDLAVKKIAAFRKELESLLDGPKRDKVYHLGVQLYRLDKEVNS